MSPGQTLFRGGTIVDGSGDEPFVGDVLIVEDRIAAVSRVPIRAIGSTVDAAGLMVTPGFIDPHVHLDAVLLDEPAFEAGIRQGVTTVIVGADGCGLAPTEPSTLDYQRAMSAAWNGQFGDRWGGGTVADYLDQFDNRAAVNVGMMLPFGCVRGNVVGTAERAARDGELILMQAAAEAAADDGALGLSWGYHYQPNTYATIAELTAVAKPFMRRGVFAAHMRDYERDVAGSIDECVQVGEAAGVSVHISHLNTSYEAAIPTMHRARQRGVPLTFDAYPYLAGMTSLVRSLPPWAKSGTEWEILSRLQHEVERGQIVHELNDPVAATSVGEMNDWPLISLAHMAAEQDRPLAGTTLDSAALVLGTTVGDAICDLLLRSRLEVSVIVSQERRRSESDLRALLASPWHVMASDGIYVGDRPHPRGFGAFARFLGHYVRDHGLMDFSDAIRHVASRPAHVFGLSTRGRIQPGALADLVLLDLAGLADRATYELPTSVADGVVDVYVNGIAVLAGGAMTGALPGKSIRAT